MEAIATGLTDEWELLQPAPRRVVYRKGAAAAGLGCVRLFLLPFIAIGICSVGWALHATVIALCGQTVPGRVLDRYYETDSEGDGSWRVRYTYCVDDTTYTATDQERGPVRLEAMQSVPVRVSPLFPGRGSWIAPAGTSSWTRVGLQWFFALFWNGVTGAFVGVCFVAPVLQRRLVSRGAVAQGRVVAKTTVGGEDTTYRLEYAFEPEQDGETITGRCNVTRAEWDSVRVGDVVTVLYSPGKPRRSTLYRFGLYRVVGS